MNSLSDRCLLAALLATLASCASHEVAQTGPTATDRAAILESRLSPDWLQGASRIRSGDRHFFYKGTATGDYTADRAWSGVISGEILILPGFLFDDSATVIEKGEVEVDSKGGFIARSRAATFAGQGLSARWKPLLRS
jgi:hypothetical protein